MPLTLYVLRNLNQDSKLGRYVGRKWLSVIASLSSLVVFCAGLWIYNVCLIRGPYVQRTTATNIVVRWRTNVRLDSIVRFGTERHLLDKAVRDSQATWDHEIILPELAPSKQYFYSVGYSLFSLKVALAGGSGTSDHQFITAPRSGTGVPIRIWVIGDSGTADANARSVRDSFLEFGGLTHTDVWLMLGDNAYDNGTDQEYQRAFFGMYRKILRRTAAWPTLGNHDGSAEDAKHESSAYFRAFTLPTRAEAGGVPSYKKAYYSFDYANVHFICLDSAGSDRLRGGAMMEWLQKDLASTIQQWVIAYWHHPPYSSGRHDSDTDIESIQMRTNALPILDAFGVDLVLNGHVHCYARSDLLNAQYGMSESFRSGDRLTTTNVNKDLYKKLSVRGSNQGSVYVVAGSSGRLETNRLEHPAFGTSLNVLGSVVVDVEGKTLRVQFLDNHAVVRDSFRIIK